MLAIASFFIWLSLGRISHEDRERIWHTIRDSKKLWILLSMAIGVLSHWIRAVRWNFLLKPLNHSIPNVASFASIMSGYFANLGIPRTGEILRASLIHKKENIPFQQLFGTIITERLIDMVMLLSITALSILINTDLILSFLKDNNINPLQIVLVLALLPLCFYITLKLIKKFKHSKLQKITRFISELIESVISVKKMPQKQYFIILTVLIWVCYIAMFFITKYSIEATSDISLSKIIVIFVIGSFAMAVTNGGLGFFPFSIATALVAFQIESNDGEAFGWLLWTSQTFLNIVLGIFGLIYFSFFGKKKVYFPNSNVEG